MIFRKIYNVAVVSVFFAVAVMSGAAAFAGLLGRPQKVETVGDAAMGVFLQGNTLYCIADDSLYALDVSSPLSPKLLGALQGMDNRRQVVVQGNLAYVASRETGLRIVDVSDPRNMRLLSRFDSVEFATGIDVVGEYGFSIRTHQWCRGCGCVRSMQPGAYMYQEDA